MAIDTRDKRASCLGIAGQYRFVLPNPDSTIDQSGRQQAAFSYSGIAAAAPGGGAAIAVLGRGVWRNMTHGTWRRMG